MTAAGAPGGRPAPAAAGGNAGHALAGSGGPGMPQPFAPAAPQPAPDPAEAERAEGERLYRWLLDQGAVAVHADVLQPAGALLDLYGEDIRARAYVTADPLQGEMMLRPDFTVPVVQTHMATGAEPARYAYMGKVFRRQEQAGPRRSEYLQVGYELFDRGDPAASDAEVFALIAEALNPLDLRAVTGDIGLIMAAVRGLETSQARKAALLRHIWRPARFRALLDRFAGRAPPDPARQALLQRLARGDAVAMIAGAGPVIGKRSQDEIAARAEALVEDAATPALPAAQALALDTLLSLSGPAPATLRQAATLAADLPGLGAAVSRCEARLDALAARGIAADALIFEAAYGRTTLEYYDGFVFGFLPRVPPPGGGDAPRPVAGGGRYDALTAVLGRGRAIPAVGGAIRPALVAALRRNGA